MIREGLDKNLIQLEEVQNMDESLRSSVTGDDDLLCIKDNTSFKRIHFTPNFEEFINIVDSSAFDVHDPKRLSIDVKNELAACLEKLRADANAVLALSTGVKGNTSKESPEAKRRLSVEEKVSSLTRQLIADAQVKAELEARLDDVNNYVQGLESERVSLENQVEQLVAKQKVLEGDLMNANKKIADLIESGHLEIISEGYGQSHPSLG